MERLNQTWIEAEQHLVAKYTVLAPFEFLIPPEHTEGLGFRKLSGVWRICYCWVGKDDEIFHNAITDTNLDNRIRMVEFLPQLKNELLESNKREIIRVEQATTKLEALYRDL